MNPLALIQGLEGPGLIVAICVLLFIEECGVPLPFAPGDLVLAIAGIAIAGGRVNAALDTQSLGPPAYTWLAPRCLYIS